MRFSTGDTVIVKLGSYRGSLHRINGTGALESLPNSMLKDGTITTIKCNSSKAGWYKLDSCKQLFSYPEDLLLSYTKIKLLNAIKDFV